MIRILKELRIALLRSLRWMDFRWNHHNSAVCHRCRFLLLKIKVHTMAPLPLNGVLQSLYSLYVYKHGLWTPKEGINQRYLKNWADVADKIWDWDWIFCRAVKAISSLGVRSPWMKWSFIGFWNSFRLWRSIVAKMPVILWLTTLRSNYYCTNM